MARLSTPGRFLQRKRTHRGGRFLDEADCNRTFRAKGKLSVGRRLGTLRRLKYSVCKRVWPRAYTRHILSDPQFREQYDAMTPKYRGHRLSKERRTRV